MKMAFLIIIMFTQISFANTKVYVGSSNPESFKADIVNPMNLSILNLRNKEVHNVGFKNSISDIKKITLETTTKKNKRISLEMLLVVLSVFDKQQSVHIYIPVKNEAMTIKGKLNPVCELKNVGDFSWDTDKDLEDRIQILTEGSERKLQLKLSQLVQGAPKFNWVTCFSF